ncbi:MAG TPA: non-homologous end-joining DNA ligase, partial [bacterium]|nr:non-homologous end-joining DNA ligase [bacterium]
MGLNEYRRKRRFDKTPEPQGAGPTAAADALPKFVVQEHHATRLHWDLRLEMEGVLRSWAVPKGPSLDPADKRLAVLVEDHPLEYGEFEGIIPEDNYGAGSVMLWDRGTYLCREGDPAAAFRAGKLTLDFFGEKMRGEFHLVRTKRNEGRDWLLFKGKDSFAAPGYVPTGTRSVKSGRPIEEIASDAGARWLPGTPPDPPGRASRARRGRKSGAAPGGDDEGADPFPKPFPPMLAESTEQPFSRPGWLFEVKWDGVRALAYIRRRGPLQEITLSSRTQHRLNAQFPEVVGALSLLDCRDVVLDGEIIAPDDQGRSSFAQLQQRLHLSGPDVADAVRRIPVVYAVFDCLYLDGHDLRRSPLSERRRVLDGIRLPAGVIRTDVVADDGRALFDAARQHGLEGIVAKRAASPYLPGVRSPAWQKIKIRQALDAVVGGFTRGKGQRARTFGALVLGQFDPGTHALVHVGQVGGGLGDADIAALRRRLDPLITPTRPFATRPRTLTPATWVRPEVVVEVTYGERTPDGVLRHPVFVRVRDDVRPEDVVLATSADTAAAAGTAPERLRPDRSAAAEVGRPAAPSGLVFTNLDKIFFPELGLTKGDVVEYYRRIGPHLVPHLRDRLLTLRRFPNGIHG